MLKDAKFEKLDSKLCIIWDLLKICKCTKHGIRIIAENIKQIWNSSYKLEIWHYLSMYQVLLTIFEAQIIV